MYTFMETLVELTGEFLESASSITKCLANCKSPEEKYVCVGMRAKNTCVIPRNTKINSYKIKLQKAVDILHSF